MNDLYYYSFKAVSSGTKSALKKISDANASGKIAVVDIKSKGGPNIHKDVKKHNKEVKKKAATPEHKHITPAPKPSTHHINPKSHEAEARQKQNEAHLKSEGVNHKVHHDNAVRHMANAKKHADIAHHHTQEANNPSNHPAVQAIHKTAAHANIDAGKKNIEAATKNVEAQSKKEAADRANTPFEKMLNAQQFNNHHKAAVKSSINAVNASAAAKNISTHAHHHTHLSQSQRDLNASHFRQQQTGVPQPPTAGQQQLVNALPNQLTAKEKAGLIADEKNTPAPTGTEINDQAHQRTQQAEAKIHNQGGGVTAGVIGGTINQSPLTNVVPSHTHTTAHNFALRHKQRTVSKNNTNSITPQMATPSHHQHITKGNSNDITNSLLVPPKKGADPTLPTQINDNASRVGSSNPQDIAIAKNIAKGVSIFGPHDTPSQRNQKLQNLQNSMKSDPHGILGRIVLHDPHGPAGMPIAVPGTDTSHDAFNIDTTGSNAPFHGTPNNVTTVLPSFMMDPNFNINNFDTSKSGDPNFNNDSSPDTSHYAHSWDDNDLFLVIGGISIMSLLLYFYL
jgi:hypothetical protein